MNRRKQTAVAVMIVAATALAGIALTALQPAAAGAEGSLHRPRDLRELVFLSSSHGLAYGPAARAQGSQAFTNIFVEPAIYRSFMSTGTWPEGTTFFMEVRAEVGHTQIGARGNSQGELLAVEAEHKDSTRYPDGGWAYFDFGPHGDDAEAQPMPRTHECYTCHRLHGAVEWTFTQFYPEQFAVAQAKGTVRKDYDATARLN